MLRTLWGRTGGSGGGGGTNAMVGISTLIFYFLFCRVDFFAKKKLLPEIGSALSPIDFRFK